MLMSSISLIKCTVNVRAIRYLPTPRFSSAVGKQSWHNERPKNAKGPAAALYSRRAIYGRCLGVISMTPCITIIPLNGTAFDRIDHRRTKTSNVSTVWPFFTQRFLVAHWKYTRPLTFAQPVRFPMCTTSTSLSYITDKGRPAWLTFHVYALCERYNNSDRIESILE